MSKVIKIRKGLDIRIQGEADPTTPVVVNIEKYAVKPLDFLGIMPKLMVAEGDKVKAGSPLFFNKYSEQVLFTSPVSGTVTEIVRGEKRVIEEICIQADEKIEYIDFGKADVQALSREEIIDRMLKGGIWPMLRQRPFSVIANPSDKPKAIFISGFDTAPLAPDNDVLVHGKGEYFQAGLDALSKLTVGKVHLNLHIEKNRTGVFTNSKNVQINWFEGKHPAGNVSVQISRIDPINKNDVIWYMHPQDVVILGRLFVEGIYDAQKIIALTGSEVKYPKYYRITAGACIEDLLNNNLEQDNVRYISGNVLTGKKIMKDGYLSAYHHQITVIPEGDYRELFGWIAPGFKKYSFYNMFFSALNPFKKFKMDTNYHGGERALVLTGFYEKVFPMDIYPMQLLKACMNEDIELMEKLGIYEVDEEDFALCEFIDVSKTEMQKIIRQGLDLVRKETM